MRRSKFVVYFVSCVALFFVPYVSGAAERFSESEAIRLLRQVDELYRGESSESELSMKIETIEWSRELKLRAWGEGMDKTLVKILEPKKDRGISTLRVHGDMWNYFPKINKVIKVAPSMMMGSWMGSDFTNDDLVRSSQLAEDYAVSLIVENDLYRFTLVPKEKTATVWGKIIVEVKRLNAKTGSSQQWIPSKYTYFDEKGNEIRVLTFSELKTFGGRLLPAKLVMKPVHKPGHQTVILYHSLNFKSKNSEDVFTLQQLKKPI